MALRTVMVRSWKRTLTTTAPSSGPVHRAPSPKCPAPVPGPERQQGGGISIVVCVECSKQLRIHNIWGKFQLSRGFCGAMWRFRVFAMNRVEETDGLTLN